jgi:hypothetical protein
MKNTLLLLLMPMFTFAQGIVFPTQIKDTLYLVKNNGIYTMVEDVYYSDGQIQTTKQILGDSASASVYLLSQSENKSNIIADLVFPEVNQKRLRMELREYQILYNSFNNRNVFVVTAARDSAEFKGNWKLIFDGERIDGVIQLNNKQRLIFNPDNGKVYTISTNLLLSTFTNQVSFAFNGVRYDLYKFANGKFATVDGEVRLIKKE